jgi:hypothetical protein
VGNDNPTAIVQRDQLSVATPLKDILDKSFHPAQTPSAPN